MYLPEVSGYRFQHQDVSGRYVLDSYDVIHLLTYCNLEFPGSQAYIDKVTRTYSLISKSEWQVILCVIRNSLRPSLVQN